jgi:hypothetical protein
MADRISGSIIGMPSMDIVIMASAILVQATAFLSLSRNPSRQWWYSPNVLI